MATQDMVDFHCELFDRCINNCDDKEDDNDQKDFEMSKDALDVADSVKMVSFEKNVGISHLNYKLGVRTLLRILNSTIL